MKTKAAPRQSKSTKITVDDHQFFRDYAHENEITIIETISLARTLLEEKYRKEN